MAFDNLDLMTMIYQDRKARAAAERAIWQVPGSDKEAALRPEYVDPNRWRAMLRRLRIAEQNEMESYEHD